MDVIKVVVIGDPQTGKSNLVKAFMDLQVDESFPQQK
jgi:GTPase SAR1 family protein